MLSLSFGHAYWLVQRYSSFVGAEYLTRRLRQSDLPDIGVIKYAIHKEFPKRLIATKQICLDSLRLCVTHHPMLLNILEQLTYGTFPKIQPFIPLIFYQFVKHVSII